MKTETLNFGTANGETTAYVAWPDNDTTKAVIVIQEYWGVNDHIKDIAGRYAEEGFIAIAPDLYRGKIATNSGDASKLMQELTTADGIDMIRNTVAKAADEYGIKHFGITGFCMGGSFALRAACELEGFSAAVAFYGDIPEEDVLKNLRTPTMFISATKDQWINTKKVAALEGAANKYELPVDSIKYDADHAFFNNTRPEVYDDAAAKDAWALVTDFFRNRL
jgi:carboxymethylenebutenolidase